MCFTQTLFHNRQYSTKYEAHESLTCNNSLRRKKAQLFLSYTYISDIRYNLLKLDIVL